MRKSTAILSSILTIVIYFLSQYVNYALIAIWLLACATGYSSQITWYQYVGTIGFMFYNWMIHKRLEEFVNRY